MSPVETQSVDIYAQSFVPAQGVRSISGSCLFLFLFSFLFVCLFVHRAICATLLLCRYHTSITRASRFICFVLKSAPLAAHGVLHLRVQQAKKYLEKFRFVKMSCLKTLRLCHLLVPMPSYSRETCYFVSIMSLS